MIKELDKPWRGTVSVEDSTLLTKHEFADGQYVFRFEAPEIARTAEPGSFVHIQCDQNMAMRRPLSIMRANKHAGWIEILFKTVGVGTTALSTRQVGDTVSIMGPIGRAFRVHNKNTRPLLIGGGVGIPPMIFLAEQLKKQHKNHQPMTIMGSEIPFPFELKPSQMIIPGIPDGVIAGMPLLEDWGLPNRLASLQGYPGCHDGYVTDLAQKWLEELGAEALKQVEVFSCGPEPMLRAVSNLAEKFGLPCQISMEEYMACAVGGCAGCVVEIETDNGPAMKRVCVDGPVFDAKTVRCLN